MNKDKAIEILTLYLPTHRWPPNPDLQDAMKLGIEALKIVRFTRQNNFRLPLGLLPGETEE